MDDEFSLRDFLRVLRRRKRVLLLTAAAISAIAASVAYGLPPVYRSSATILIEKPSTREFVQSSGGSSMGAPLIEPRLQTIQRKVTSSASVGEIITRFDLYPEARVNEPMGRVVDRMRRAIKFNQLNAEVVDRVNARTSQVAIGFMLSFDHSDPHVAQHIAGELVQRFLDENLKERREQSTETAAFLAGELERLEAAIGEKEARIATFKAKHSGALPEDLPFIHQLVERYERDLTDTSRQIQSIEQRRAALRAELMQIDSRAPVIVSIPGGRLTSMTASAQLQAAELEYARLATQYGPLHPKIIQAQRDIATMKAALAGNRSSPAAAALDNPTAGPAGAGGAQRKRSTASAQSIAPDNPAYLAVKAQIDGIEAEYRTLTDHQASTREQLDLQRTKIRGMPEVEREYLELRRDYETASTRQKDLKRKLVDAEIAQKMEQDNKTERFSMIEAPDLPIAAVKPPRRLILGIGLLFALGVGLGVALTAEALSSVVHSRLQVQEITGAPPLIAIPHIRASPEIAGARRATLTTLIAVLFLLLFGAGGLRLAFLDSWQAVAESPPGAR
jgi:protein tyrosine kinase modulator